jgi:hypothetical protein
MTPEILESGIWFVLVALILGFFHFHHFHKKRGWSKRQ